MDVVVEGECIAKIIKCLEKIQDKILSSEIRDNYINIISYDAISEYYCNQIVPELNILERNLRKLFFCTYIVNYGSEYYQETISSEIQEKIKRIINSSKCSGEKSYTQQFFYSFEFGDIQQLLFKPNWQKFHEKERDEFLRTHDDLSKLSDDELRKAFLKFTPQEDWNRFFSDKIKIDNISSIIKEIGQYRNAIAHFKLFNEEDYIKSKKLMTEFNKNIVKAIKLTEEIDIFEKGVQSISDAIPIICDVLQAFAIEMQMIMEERSEQD